MISFSKKKTVSSFTFKGAQRSRKFSIATAQQAQIFSFPQDFCGVRAWRGFRRCGRTPLEFALAPRPYLKLWPKQTSRGKIARLKRQPRSTPLFCFLLPLPTQVGHDRVEPPDRLFVEIVHYLRKKKFLCVKSGSNFHHTFNLLFFNFLEVNVAECRCNVEYARKIYFLVTCDM